MEEFYTIHTDFPGQDPDRGPRSGFVGRDGLLEPFSRALRFPSLEAAEAHLETLAAPGHRFLIQLCSREQTDAEPDNALSRLLAQVMEIPPPYRRTAYNWLRGKDVEALLRRQGAEVYERHVAALAEHGLDVTRPSDIVIMKPRRRSRPVNRGARANDPLQFVALPSQRPSVAPLLDESGEDD